MIDQNLFVSECNHLREQRPLVLSITNYVAMNISANALLAVGASPLMSFCPEEMEELVAACGALCVNIGCLDSQQMQAMRLAVAAAKRCGKPWVLDPVGVGASMLRSDICRELLTLSSPAVIRANADEIRQLAKEQHLNLAADDDFAGLESSSSTAEALPAAQLLARHNGCVVVVSGVTDLIVDNSEQTRVATIDHGSPLMKQVTAMGCSVSALVAAHCAVQPDAFQAATHAMLRTGLAGEQAAEQAAGPGTFVPLFLDALSRI